MKPFLVAFLVCLSSAAAAEEYVPGSDQDPRDRTADFYAETRRFLAASAILTQVQKDAPRQQLASEYFQRLADNTLDFGMPKRAEAVYREQMAKAKDPVAAARARLQLAEFRYERGSFEEANAELLALRQQLPQPLFLSWQDLMSRVMLAQGRYKDAADTLDKPGNASDQTAYMRYNLAIALLNSDQVEQGLTVLDRVGTRSANNSEGLALRDKANLTLGYYWLRKQQGGSAAPIFNRVRTEGPYSNQALLGLGWAYLSPQGDKQKRAKVEDDSGSKDKQSFSTIGAILRPGFLDNDIYKRAQLRPFQLDHSNPNDEANFKRALVPWLELLTRDPIDPSVQEGMLAIPYVLDQLGAHEQAKQFYERSITALEQTRTNLDQAILSIRYGRMVDTIIKRNVDSDSGWKWKLKDLPDAPETFYLQGLLADHPFQEALKELRDARLLIRDCDAERARIDELESVYDTRAAQPVSQPELQQRISSMSQDAMLDYKVDKDQVPPLHMSQSLGSSQPDTQASAVTAPPVKLRMPNAPPRFDGPYEKLEALKVRIDALNPKLQATEQAANLAVQKIALGDLEVQRKLNEKYLIEARFALARIYDRQSRGDSP